MIAYQFAILCSIICGLKFSVAISQVSYSEISRKEPHAILALESVFQERSILLIEIIGKMSCFQVEATEDIRWIIAPDESVFLVVDELGDGVVTLLPGVLAEIGEVDKLIAVISAHSVRRSEPDESVSVLDDVVHRIARQTVLSRESFPVQFDAA